MTTTRQLTAADPDTPADDTEVVEIDSAIDPARIVDVDADEHDTSTASAHDASTHHASAHDAGTYEADTYDASAYDAGTHDADSDIRDPEFDALVAYLEAVARRVVTEWREATAPPPEPPATDLPIAADANDAAPGPAIAPEPEPETEPEPGTHEYDELHGIPWFELYR